jgi:hypothetical protein
MARKELVFLVVANNFTLSKGPTNINIKWTA